MVKLTKYILLACIVLTQQACVKDLQDDINDGGWNHERTILDIQFENQMGTALIETVDAATGDINLAINVDAVPDLSNIRLKKLQLSYQAEASLEVGDALNFLRMVRGVRQSLLLPLPEKHVIIRLPYPNLRKLL